MSWLYRKDFDFISFVIRANIYYKSGTLFFFFFSFWLSCTVNEILVLWPGIEPRPLAERVWSQWTTEEFPRALSFMIIFIRQRKKIERTTMLCNCPKGTQFLEGNLCFNTDRWFQSHVGWRRGWAPSPNFSSSWDHCYHPCKTYSDGQLEVEERGPIGHIQGIYI